jgi:hypothetical protein
MTRIAGRICVVMRCTKLLSEQKGDELTFWLAGLSAPPVSVALQMISPSCARIAVGDLDSIDARSEEVWGGGRCRLQAARRLATSFSPTIWR